ncbi:hypothetical protein RvY_03001 [Ramazzottius varieornatus]|uniref:Uncharacterized protein n=1 Tax=Ramazzottius varieornatus TaxID=947166 RepID=A0A1D1ULK8_RAMVA|nr:hypothetical protein RvY_03001 [Ramazzottius varieornatus]
MKLIGPYANEQLQWLLDSLKNLDSRALEMVKNADETWQTRKYEGTGGQMISHRSQVWVNQLDKLDLTASATCNARKLTFLDKAFLGRLLTAMHSIKPVPNVELPPQAFPNDFRICFEETM